MSHRRCPFNTRCHRAWSIPVPRKVDDPKIYGLCGRQNRDRRTNLPWNTHSIYFHGAPPANIGHTPQLRFPVMLRSGCGGCGRLLTFTSHARACFYRVMLSTHARGEQQSPLSRKNLGFQGSTDNVAGTDGPEFFSGLSAADVSDDDSYSPSVQSDDSLSDDENEIDWAPIPFREESLNIRFNGADSATKDQYLREAKEVRKRFIKQVCLNRSCLISS